MAKARVSRRQAILGSVAQQADDEGAADVDHDSAPRKRLAQTRRNDPFSQKRVTLPKAPPSATQRYVRVIVWNQLIKVRRDLGTRREGKVHPGKTKGWPCGQPSGAGWGQISAADLATEQGSDQPDCGQTQGRRFGDDCGRNESHGIGDGVVDDRGVADVETNESV